MSVSTPPQKNKGGGGGVIHHQLIVPTKKEALFAERTALVWTKTTILGTS